MSTLNQLIASLFIFFFSISVVLCQSTDIEDDYKSIRKLYGANQIPLNGKLSSYIPGRTISWPYLISDEFFDGDITVHNVAYSNIQLRYNVFDQTVEVLYVGEGDICYSILPPANFVSSFTLNKRRFKRYAFNGNEDFYQVVYEGDLTCLYHYQKKRSESSEGLSHVKLEYHATKRSSYMLIDSSLVKFGSKAGFIGLFPKKYKEQIKAYMKSNRISLKDSGDDEIAALVEFCERITNE